MLKVEGKKTFAYCDIQDCAEFIGIGGGSPIGAERLRRLGWYIKRVSRKRRVCLCPIHGRPLYEIAWQKQRDARERFMRYLIRKEQAAALGRVLRKMKDARLEEIIGLTEKEMQAWKDKVPYWDSRETRVIDAPLEDVPDPTPEVAKPLASVVSVVIPETQKKTLIRWMRIDPHKKWSAGEWYDNTPENTEKLNSVLAHKRTRDMACGLTYDYKIDEKEMQDDENY